MLAQTLCAMFIVVMLSIPVLGGNLNAAKARHADNQFINTLSVVEKRVIHYYTANDGTLPDSLIDGTIDDELKEILGLVDVDLEGIRYNKLTDNTYTLEFTNSADEIVYSGRSNCELNMFEPESY